MAEAVRMAKEVAGVWWFREPTDAAADMSVVTLAAFLAGPDAARAVGLAPEEDPRALVPYLAQLRRIVLAIPVFTDGRALSSARILRELGYRGELLAEGDIGVDQLVALRRVGFDAAAPRVPLDPEVVTATLARWRYIYQPDAPLDDTDTPPRAPIWALRHGLADDGPPRS